MTSAVTSPVSRPRRLRLVLAAVLATGLLGGCSLAGTEFRPGVAAEVGSTRISTNLIDDSVSGACAYFAENAQPGVGASARGGLRTQLLTLLVQEEVYARLVEEVGAELGPEYQQNLTRLDEFVQDLPEEQAEGLRVGNQAAAYVESAKLAVGRALLAREGQSNPSDEEAVARGEAAFADWVAEHEVALNPMFGLELQDGALVPSDDAVSQPVSEFAVGGGIEPNTSDPAEQQAYQAYVASLPVEQRCG